MAVHREREALLGRAHRVDVGHPLDLGRQVERDALDPHLTGLDAGDVEQVGDEAEQVGARCLDEFHPLLHERIGRLDVDQPRHPEHAVDRRAQLVADRAEELALHGRLALHELERLHLLGRDARRMDPQQEDFGQLRVRTARGDQQLRQEQAEADRAVDAERIGPHQHADHHRHDDRHDVGAGRDLADLQAERRHAGDAAQARGDERGGVDVGTHQPESGDAPDRAIEGEQPVRGLTPSAAAGKPAAPEDLALNDARHRDQQLHRDPELDQAELHAAAQVERHHDGEGGGDQRADSGMGPDHAQLFVGDLLLGLGVELDADAARDAFDHRRPSETLQQDRKLRRAIDAAPMARLRETVRSARRSSVRAAVPRIRGTCRPARAPSAR